MKLVDMTRFAPKKKIGMLELVDRFRLGRNGFITVQVQILLPIHGEHNMI